MSASTSARSQFIALVLLAAGTSCGSPTERADPVPDGSDGISLAATDPLFAGNAGLAQGGSLQMVAIASPSLDTIESARLAWSVSDPTVLHVSSAGVVTGLKPGTAAVTATTGGFTATRSIGVWQVDSVQIYRGKWPGPLHPMLLGDTSRQTVSVILTAGRGVPNVAGVDASWSSADPAVVSIDSSGLMRAHSVGAALITLTSSVAARVSASDTQTVQVFAESAVRIRLDPVIAESALPISTTLSGTLSGAVTGSPRPFTVAVTLRRDGESRTSSAYVVRAIDDTTIAWRASLHGLTAGEYEVTAWATDAMRLWTVAVDTISVADIGRGYAVVPLGTAPLSGSKVVEANDHGMAVGHGMSGTAVRAILWHGGTATVLATPHDGDYHATDVNRDGVVAGVRTWKMVTAEHGTRNCRNAVRWGAAGFEVLPGEPECYGSTATRINDRGHVLISGVTRLVTDTGSVAIDMHQAGHLDERSRVVGKVFGVDKQSLILSWDWEPFARRVADSDVPVALNNRGTLLIASSGLSPRYRLQGVFEATGTAGHVPLLEIGGAGFDVDDSDWVVGSYGGSLYLSGDGRVVRVDPDSGWTIESVAALTNAGEIVGMAVHASVNGGAPVPVRLSPR